MRPNRLLKKEQPWFRLSLVGLALLLLGGLGDRAPAPSESAAAAQEPVPEERTQVPPPEQRPYEGRTGTVKQQLLQEGGGNTRSESAVAAGLKWLALHQAEDGHWSLDAFHEHGKCNCRGAGRANDIAGTAWGLLPFLGAGISPKPQAGPNQPYLGPVQRGLKYLLRHQDRDGKMGGDLTTHSLATLALCEAYGLTADPTLREPAQRALNALMQQRTADTTVLVWQASAYKSGQLAGLSVPREFAVGGNKFLDQVAARPFGDRYGINAPPGPRPAGNPPELASAAGLLCRQYLGWGSRNPGMVRGVEELSKARPTASLKDLLYYYLANQVMYNMGGQLWREWNPRLRDLLIATQDQGADPNRRHQKGSWSQQGDAHLSTGGRLQMTAVALLTLEVYYRHRTLYPREMGGLADGPASRALDEAERRHASAEAAKSLLAQSGKPPSTWQRDRHRPTFARVYVGDGNSLELVSLQVTVTIDGPRARTLVDHIFRNPHDRQLEGTFDYPLPTEASPSYYAMFLGQTRDTVPPRFVRRGAIPPLTPEALASLTPLQVAQNVSTADWGTLQEGRIVMKEKALETYEEIVRGQIDPALLEYAGGNTFSGRVFPIPAKGYNRVLIAYEELLPVVQEQVVYRYPLPDCKLTELQFTLQASATESSTPTFLPRDGKRTEAGGRLNYTRTWTDKGPGSEAVFAYQPVRPQVQAISGRHGDSGPLYAYARLRPELPKVAVAQPFAQHAVFLLDTSLSEHPDRFAVSMKLLRKILETDSDIRHFNILAFSTGSTWVEPGGWLPNTAAGRDKAWARLDGLVLEGATDLSAALERLAVPGFDIARGTPLNVFLLSDGQITWGEPDIASLVARFEGRCPYPTRFHCYRTGLGADTVELFEALTRKGGGVFNCFSEADLPAAAAAHRQQCLQVERVRFADGPTASDVLLAGRKASVYPGGELIVAGRMSGLGRSRVVLEGTFLGRKVVQEYPVEIQGGSELAPRAWGEIAVANLLALNDDRLDKLVTAYCQEFRIGSRVASFLVLENVNDYQRLNLEQERGQTLKGDLGQFIETMWTDLGRLLPPREAVRRFLARLEPRVELFKGPHGQHVKKLLDLLNDADCELPQQPSGGALLRKADVPAAYLAAREADRRQVDIYLTEARRRAARDVDGAVRVLSSVVEEYPSRADALRLVGYRLLDLQQAGQAARVFQQVQRNRPFEPHSYRDLARSLEESGRFGLAALQYEIVLAGKWHQRFHQSLQLVAQEEYARMMEEALRRKTVRKELLDHFGERLKKMAVPAPTGDLRVTISWNTDATDVDLWVIEPDGTRCFYSHNRTKNGGELSQDQTQGYGPERYQVKKALPGEYTVIVHYYSANPNLLAGETHVNVVVARHAGTPREVVQKHTVILKQRDEQVEVCKVKF